MSLAEKTQFLAQVFSCAFCEISKNTFFYRTPPDDCFCSWALDKIVSCDKWGKIFKNGPSKICGRQLWKTLNFLKAVLYKFYLIHSWILCSKYSLFRCSLVVFPINSCFGSYGKTPWKTFLIECSHCNWA